MTVSNTLEHILQLQQFNYSAQQQLTAPNIRNLWNVVRSGLLTMRVMNALLSDSSEFPIDHKSGWKQIHKDEQFKN